jgi:predicted metal-dependent phosphoesterase TrpH
MQLQTWSSADLHIHTSASDGVATPEMVLEWVCRETDLAVIAITDHNTNSGALEAARLVASGDYDVEVIVGQEVESSDGHVIGLWAPDLVRPGMTAAETVAAIRAQGGLAIAAHPFAPRFWARAGLDRGSRLVYDSAGYDGIEIANSTPLLFLANWFARFYWTTHHRRLFCTGGSDAHILRAIGSSRTWFPGESAADLRAAMESRMTRAELPGVSLVRNWFYAWNVPRIMARDRDRKAREVEAGIRPEHRRRRRAGN